MSSVVLVRCETYEDDTVKVAVLRGVNLLGGAGRFAKSGEKILLKVNLLVGDAPEKCVNTHPSVFRAVGELFKATGANVSYGDSPAFGSSIGASRKAKIAEVAEKAGIEFKDFHDGREVNFAEGKQNKKFTIANAVLESDGIISLPKLKTHAFQKFTGCIKNQFGCVPGLLKGEFHVKLPDPEQFARMLVDLDRLVHPRLYIMDGVYAMEGNGPRGGTPRKMNVLMFSEDPVALDATVCRLIDLDPEKVPTVKYGQEAGHGTFEQEKIELLGDDFKSFKTEQFIINRSRIRIYRAKGVMKFLSATLLPRPVIDKKKCIKCGICIKMCPVNPKAVNWDNEDTAQAPRHDYQRCIRCYCCQEVCPEKAITIKKPLLRSLFSKKR